MPRIDWILMVIISNTIDTSIILGHEVTIIASLMYPTILITFLTSKKKNLVECVIWVCAKSNINLKSLNWELN